MACQYRKNQVALFVHINGQRNGKSLEYGTQICFVKRNDLKRKIWNTGKAKVKNLYFFVNRPRRPCEQLLRKNKCKFSNKTNTRLVNVDFENENISKLIEGIG